MDCATPEGTLRKLLPGEAVEIERFSRSIFSGVALARRMRELEISMPNASILERLDVYYAEGAAS